MASREGYSPPSRAWWPSVGPRGPFEQKGPFAVYKGLLALLGKRACGPTVRSLALG